jgi:hypothetical protein
MVERTLGETNREAMEMKPAMSNSNYLSDNKQFLVYKMY